MFFLNQGHSSEVWIILRMCTICFHTVHTGVWQWHHCQFAITFQLSLGPRLENCFSERAASYSFRVVGCSFEG